MATTVPSKGENLAKLLPCELSDIADRTIQKFKVNNKNTNEIIKITSQQNYQLLKYYQELELIYAGLCIAQQQSKKVIYEAYALAVIMHYVYARLLVNNQRKNQLADDLLQFHALLTHQRHCREPLPHYKLAQVGFEQFAEKPVHVEIKWWQKFFCIGFFRNGPFVKYNRFRLLVVRSPRLFLLIAHSGIVYTAATNVSFCMKLIYISVWFYALRLLPNIYTILKHTFDTSALTPEERALGWKTRLATHISRRRFQLLNDAVWLGIDLSVYLVNATLGMNLIALLYVFDVMNELFDYYQLNKKIKSVDQRLQKGEINVTYAESIKNYLNQKKKEKLFSVGVAVVLCVAMVPVASYAVPPVHVLMAMGAGLALMTTIFQIWYSRRVAAKYSAPASIDTAAIDKNANCRCKLHNKYTQQLFAAHKRFEEKQKDREPGSKKYLRRDDSDIPRAPLSVSLRPAASPLSGREGVDSLDDMHLSNPVEQVLDELSDSADQQNTNTEYLHRHTLRRIYSRCSLEEFQRNQARKKAQLHTQSSIPEVAASLTCS